LNFYVAICALMLDYNLAFAFLGPPTGLFSLK